MVAKTQIMERLGERAVLLPTLIEGGVAANDRLKIRLSLLQEAAAQASHPGRDAPSMERELRAVGLTDSSYGATVSGAQPIDADTFVAPGAERLAVGIAGYLTAMMESIEVAETADATRLRARLESVLKALPSFKDDRVAHAQVKELASASSGGADTLHLLVTDLHRELKSCSRGSLGRADRRSARPRTRERRPRPRAGVHEGPQSHEPTRLRPSRARDHGGAGGESPDNPE